jgi:hypothetical protein
MKKNKLPSLITIMILTLITSVLWVSFSTYRAFTAKPSESVAKEISEPINLTLDQNVIKKIESGIFFDNTQISNNVTVASASPFPILPTHTPLPTSTPSATLTPAPSPTP